MDMDTRKDMFENISGLSRLFIQRRSFRKYSAKIVEQEKVDAIKKSAELFVSKMGLKFSRISITKDKEEFDLIVKSATSGILGKINPWLKNSTASHIIIAIANMDGIKNNKERLERIAETSMLMQIAILRATELNLATCWMAGINSKEIEKNYPKLKDEEIIAISPLGYPPTMSSITDYDYWANRLVSGKRKPLSELIFYDEIKL